jgi:hypothetical protein
LEAAPASRTILASRPSNPQSDGSARLVTPGARAMGKIGIEMPDGL